ncbi:sensor histidine kinase [Bacteroidales bacterium OttesenSCG-928-J19]|nr:sensor histidine kinase [Bacteroidales bacterium OttesenSCG-928-J19]
MKKLIYLLLFLLPSSFLSAQINADSLETVLNTQQLTADEELSIYKQLSNAYRNSNPDKLILYARKVLDLAIGNENENYAVATSYYYIGMAHHIKANIDSAFIYYQKALDFALETDDKQTETSVYISMGFIYCDRNEYTKGLEYYMKALTIAEETENIPQQINILANIGTTYRRFNNNDHALQYFERVEKLAEETDSPNGKCMAYFNIGGICQDQGDMQKALEYQLKAMEISRTVHIVPYEIGSLLSIAQIYYSDELGEYQKSEQYATEALSIAEKYGDPQMIKQTYATLANLYARQKNYEKCDIAATMAWEMDTTDIVSGKDFIFSIVHANIFLGNKDKAAEYLDKLFKIVREVNDKNLHDSLAEMEVKYETEKKEMRIASLEKDRKLYIGLGVAIVIALLFAIGLLFYRHRLVVQRRKMAEQQVKQLEQEQEVVAARSALNAEKTEREIIARDLHDGVGAMLSVVKNNMDIMKSYSIIETKEAEYFNKALDGLDRSITELRRVAHHIMPAILVEKGLFVALDDFCRTIPEVEFHSAESEFRFDAEKELVFYRCAYELVNNALRHSGASSIEVHLNTDETTVYLSVVDNGCGFDPQKVSVGMGIGNMRTRLSVFDGRIDIYSEPGKGTEVNIELDL